MILKYGREITPKASNETKAWFVFWFFAILFCIFTSSVPPLFVLPILNIPEIMCRWPSFMQDVVLRTICCKCGSRWAGREKFKHFYNAFICRPGLIFIKV